MLLAQAILHVLHHLIEILQSWAAHLKLYGSPKLRRHSAAIPAPCETLTEVGRLRRQEFSRLGARVYADYAGAPPFSETALRAATDELLAGVHGNPHSEHGWGASGGGASAAAAERLRHLTLEMCRADPAQYICVLTSGATAALKLVADAFPWGAGSTFLYLRDNHNSVLGIREVAAQRGAATAAVAAADLRPVPAGAATSPEGMAQDAEGPDHLFAFPLESNFAGVRYSDALVEAVQQRRLTMTHPGSDSDPAAAGQRAELAPGRWRVLLDAAKACGSRPPNLSAHPADFVALSYYKIFGHPTGVGALLVRRDALPVLQRAYFGGGAVAAAAAERRFHRPRPGAAGLEDGTPPFLSLPAAIHGFAFLQRAGGWAAIDQRAGAVAARLRSALQALRHGSGALACKVYFADGSDAAAGEWGAGLGAVVTFNVLRSDAAGGVVGYRQVERVAALEGISLRGGCMCNPGACAQALGLTPDDIQANFEAGHVCWGDADVIRGRPTGAVRASFGYASAPEDADAIVACVRRYFVDSSSAGQEEGVHAEAESGVSGAAAVQALFVYPIKSCAGFRAQAWPLGAGGLLYDRHWAVVDGDGRALTLGRCPSLANITPVVDLDAGLLRVRCAGMDRQLVLPLPTAAQREHGCAVDRELVVNVCAREEAAEGCSGAADSVNDAGTAAWLRAALGVPCRLVQVASGAGRPKAAGRSGRAFANDGHLLVVSASSLAVLQAQAGVACSPERFAARFRPNLIVGSAAGRPAAAVRHSGGGTGVPAPAAALPPYSEESWQRVELAGVDYDSAGPCPRCEVVCLDPDTGRRDGSEPLRALARRRRQRRQGGDICFGLLLNRSRTQQHTAALPACPATAAVCEGMLLTFHRTMS